jgi:hypothetical protein
MGSGQIKPDPDTAIQPVDGVIIASQGQSSDKAKAVGLCRFANPFKGKPVTVSCFAETKLGTFNGEFVTDGSEPSPLLRKP